ncbi:MAG TPA: sensor histidine kinase KdpD, partial [Candidatus Edwardsbacteria bacterium]|nr:sensor histidine kinase KdpD [Candidatus Edwardsbacteria bacterium]
RRAEGLDVVVGYVETHHRAETEARLEGLQVIPRRGVEHRGVMLGEMDLDTILDRHPALVLVDELAHTNAPGSRHAKRYQDVEELLAAGIDVYTTLNIQHLESLNDVVAQITGVTVRETIPDWVIDQADDLELVDLPPDELQRRLEEGKVYVPDEAARAIQKFFRRGNLTALRELALRRAAERVGDQMRAYMQVHAILGPWHAEERILVCISPSLLSERLIRAARRLSDELGASWWALYVETPEHSRLTEAERDRVGHALQLAEELGARTTRLPGGTVADTAVEFARAHNVTKIIVGKPLRPYWLDMLRGSIIDNLIRQSGEIDVFFISTEATPRSLVDALHLKPSGRWIRYLPSLIAVLVATLISSMMHPMFAAVNLVMVYLLAVVVVALRWGRGPAILTSLLSVATFDFFFTPPRLTFVVDDAEYILTFLVLLVVGLVISNLAAQAREQAQAAQRRQTQTAALYDLSKELAGSAGLPAVLDVIVRFFTETFAQRVGVLLAEKNKLTLRAASLGLTISPDEMAVANWVFHQGHQAGRGTDTLPASNASYFPLRTAQGTVGVLGIVFNTPEDHLTPEQRRFLEASASLCALAIERTELADQARQVQLMQEAEKLQTALLNSISHDLRTPLASITGALSSLRADAAFLDEATRAELARTALDEAERLNRLVGNLLDMTRLEADTVKVNKELCDVQDVIGVALQEVDKRLGDRQVIIDVPENTPPTPMDLVLIARVMVNLLDNAIKYSPPGGPVEIRVRGNHTEVQFAVADRGEGIPPEDLSRIFDKFYRVERPDNVVGTGLGLSISRGIVEAHGGHIWAENRPDRGTIVLFTLPLAGAQETTGVKTGERIAAQNPGGG